MIQSRFPFSAVVGLDSLKTALLLNLVDPRIGGVMISGDKGTAKTTLVRSLIDLVGGSPLIELPLGATEDRVVGSIDVRAALKEGQAQLRKGVLAQADGGILYVDEMNLLPDHLVDLILDAAATGVCRIERDGISGESAARFILIGTMNPEEGQLRPQLLDRFGLYLHLSETLDAHQRREALARRLGFDSDPDGFVASFSGCQSELNSKISAARHLVSGGDNGFEEGYLDQVSAFCFDLGAVGLRGDMTLARAGRAYAALTRSERPNGDDLMAVAPFVFAHRPGVETQGGSQNRSELSNPDRQRPTAKAQAQQNTHGKGPGDMSSEDPRDRRASASQSTPRSSEPTQEATVPESMAEAPEDDAQGNPEPTSDNANRGAQGGLGSSMLTPLLTTSQSLGGKGAGSHVGYVGEAPRDNRSFDLLQSVVASLTRGRNQGSDAIVEEDLRFSERVRRQDRCVLFGLDASKSMSSPLRSEICYQTIEALLANSYQKRLRVALVVFNGHGASVALRPTRAMEIARARIGEVEYFGNTPLGMGLQLMSSVAKELVSKGTEVLSVVITDGRTNATQGPHSPVQEAFIEAHALALVSNELIFCDVEEGHRSLGLVRELAEAVGGTYVQLQPAGLL